jgi:hypothetical protein
VEVAGDGSANRAGASHGNPLKKKKAR